MGESALRGDDFTRRNRTSIGIRHAADADWSAVGLHGPAGADHVREATPFFGAAMAAAVEVPVIGML